jgi:glycerol-3-phosphate cytidylyltransferase
MAMRVLTVGTFDTIHAGHIGLFNQCRRLAGPTGAVIVGVNGDDFVATYKGKPPLVPIASRLAVIRNLRMVDETFINAIHWAQPQTFSQQNPDILVVGEDWARNNYLIQIGATQKWLDDNNIQLCYVPRTGEWSSTEIKRALG